MSAVTARATMLRQWEFSFTEKCLEGMVPFETIFRLAAETESAAINELTRRGFPVDTFPGVMRSRVIGHLHSDGKVYPCDPPPEGYRLLINGPEDTDSSEKYFAVPTGSNFKTGDYLDSSCFWWNQKNRKWMQ